MNKDRINGAVDETVGRAKRKLGEVTGNPGQQVEGALQELKGKAETAAGKLEDAVHNAQNRKDGPTQPPVADAYKR